MTRACIGIAAVMALVALAGPARAADFPLTIVKVTGDPALGQTITIDVTGLDKLSEERRKRLVLFLNDQPMPPKDCRVFVADNSRLVVDLRRSEDSKTAWASVLGSPGFSFTRQMNLNIGDDNRTLFAADFPITFTIFENGWQLWLSLAMFVFALVLFAWLVTSSDILRDSGPPPAGGRRKPYSLGRSQMAFWLFLVMGAFLLIWLVTADRNTMPDTVLGLMGISAATALGSAFVDFGKRQSAAGELANLQAEATALTQRTAELQGIAARTDDQSRELAEKTGRQGVVTNRIAELSAATTPPATQGFVRDVLADSTGVTLHRFQMIVWTFVLGLIFVTEVYRNLAMPSFSPTLLALMGISAGTYIGFKFPEK